MQVFHLELRKKCKNLIEKFIAIKVEEINEIIDALKSGWITTGPKTKQFENNFKHGYR